MADMETLTVEMTPAALARMNEATRVRERGRIANLLDMQADAIATAGHADAAIMVANFAEGLRQSAPGLTATSAGTGLYGSKVDSAGEPVVPPVALAEVVYAEELPQVQLRDDAEDVALIVAHHNELVRLEQMAAFSRG